MQLPQLRVPSDQRFLDQARSPSIKTKMSSPMRCGASDHAMPAFAATAIPAGRRTRVFLVARTGNAGVMAEFDVVLRGGRVVDPESGMDAVRDVAVAGDRVARIGPGLPPGRLELDVAGQVVTSGFIDIHSHAYDLGSLRLQAMDGVTTALELEAGTTPVAAAYEVAARVGRPLNYGFAASWAMARMEALAGVRLDGGLAVLFRHIADPGWQRTAAPAEADRVLARLEADLADGALGIGVLAGYAPGADPAEYLGVAALAARAGAPTFTHSRDLAEFTPRTLVDGAEEIVRAARRST